jgi:CreA protein
MNNKLTIAFLLALGLFFAPASSAQEIVGKTDAGGFFIPDTIEVMVFDDPDIQGVACYVTYYDRTLSFNDSSNSSIACRKVGTIAGELTGRQNVFEAEKSIFFKTTRVQRFYDLKRKVLVYLAYTRGNNGKNAAHSISVVPVGQ